MSCRSCGTSSTPAAAPARSSGARARPGWRCRRAGASGAPAGLPTAGLGAAWGGPDAVSAALPPNPPTHKLHDLSLKSRRWIQTSQDVSVTVAVPEGTRAAEVQVRPVAAAAWCSPARHLPKRPAAGTGRTRRCWCLPSARCQVPQPTHPPPVPPMRRTGGDQPGPPGSGAALGGAGAGRRSAPPRAPGRLPLVPGGPRGGALLPGGTWVRRAASSDPAATQGRGDTLRGDGIRTWPACLLLSRHVQPIPPLPLPPTHPPRSCTCSWPRRRAAPGGRRCWRARGTSAATTSC